LLAEPGAVSLGERPALLLLVLVIAANAIRSSLEGIALWTWQVSQCRLQLLACDFELMDGLCLNAVKLSGERQQRLITAGLHLTQNPCGSGVDGIVLLGIDLEQLLQRLVKSWSAGIQSGNHGHDVWCAMAHIKKGFG